MVDTAKIKALCVKLGFDDLSDEEMERVIARLSKPQPMQVRVRVSSPSIAAASMLLSIAAAAVRARDRDTLLRLAPVTGHAMLPRPPAHRCQSRRSTSTRRSSTRVAAPFP
jgi:hypothetical protein